ncbi:MAG: acyl-CoA dehydrogenase family protein [Alicycliphilus sp.]|jgi:alkylation response protein AidB-like acyl-CoA dehydrogenase|uniref:Acyl-CoA dehydrogenase family protein n=1 Tax=Diaphorobacter limosus TaxID=3036128 RepID=A0ABZ0J3C1_9BURK|nr:acyl-CoA dehydrogenase family protein [Diaphorobacter sp. Y-1]MBP6751751.1 acyl-CoA dehydrogenase family protein [Alicycliphilus sp.]MBP7326858.1 acyl-CoA dehydrogenase family protein [Alicycliphilus sp.]MBP7329884.1 acyl-CoA dehydrogenase family protein [Alicycliphilus sp.]MBP8137967.1 acyl-CoA dehydrogenase family protein [Alicycliphilus sp.]TXJ10758.1 MAG: acyl-CoA dehydrogenase [Alicycliphilus sp.]
MNQTNRLGVSPDDQAVADAVARFATETLAPRAREIDEHGLSTTCHVPQLAALGVMGMNLPEQLGGAGVTPTAMLLSLVEISRACAATSSMIGAHYLGTDAVLIGGSPEQHARWLPRAASGEWLAGFALTEPRGGSHPADLRTRAVREGEHYRIDGVKHFISNAKEARFLVVFAKTDPEAGARGVSAFVVETDSPGISISSPEKLMGIQGAHAFEVAFDGVRVPAANRLGAEGTGFKTAMKVLDNSRLDVAATALGIAEAALADATRWMRERQIGGEPIASKQGLQWMLADMKLRLEASWALTLQALALRQAGQPFTLQSAMAKLHASEMVGFVTDAALQIHGGYGYTREMPLERYVRDARILRIYEGSSEVQRNIIARMVLAD